MNKSLSILICAIFFIMQRPVIAVDTAPHISDREIVESLTEIRGDIKRLEDGQKKLAEELQAVEWRLNKRVDDLRSEMNGHFDDINHRFDTLQWMFGLFVTIALVILGFVLRMQWQMHQRQTRIETILETQRDELSFIKGIIEKLLPPKGML